MRHGKKVMHLGRKTAHRKSMLSNMACSLIEHKRINTTVTKAKALKQFVEPIITKAKSDTTHNRRLVFSSLRDKETVTELFRDIAKKVGDRPGGYTRIIKLGNRLGDNASMAMIELVDYNEVYKSEATEKKKTRRRGGKAKTTASETVIEVKEETAPVAEEAIPEIDTKNDEDTENAK
ncbi:50S ribosomal protein L17 [Flavobacteriaceae bacterium]|jgi:large subunit ribosomal protein L17|nr:50S ribosomal protein L17 [Flavobacteriaceae bacterium]MDB4255376.1 50S ribosomal protein L17 [Flavobacteriaceae bacterium]MDC0001356.1 50S ribosomal protein L17 [Flavobacteriaceae bacterium]MDC1392111.1 50S ribosomal protein L17 [Flavobacteriaceae bacterium]|tara:strand:+ start:895 stop:1428 length:534 start_codon:yes stop_codon:yes gene_type:complete